jgi:hypothetical protein
MSPQVKKSDFELYRYFNATYNFFINWLKSSDGALYKRNIIVLGVIVLRWTAQISKTCFLQWWKISICLNHWSFLTKTQHTPSFCRFSWQKLEPNKSQVMWGAADPVLPCVVPWYTVCGGLCHLLQKIVLIHYFLFLAPLCFDERYLMNLHFYCELYNRSNCIQ